MKRKLNRRFLLWLLASLLVVGGGGYAVYAWQKRRAAEELLARSLEAEKAGREEEALDVLGQYLSYRPRDLEALARYAFLLDRRVNSPRARAQALSLFEKVLEKEPGRRDVRRQLARSAVELRRFDVARKHLPELIRVEPGDGEHAYHLARCHEEAKEPGPAAEWFAKAAELNPANLDAWERLAGVQADGLRKADEAAKSLDRMVDLNPRSARARLVRGRFHRKGDTDRWREDVAAAERLAPEEPEVLIAAARVAADAGDLDAARAKLAGCLERRPKDLEAAKMLGSLELSTGRAKEAAAAAERGLREHPDDRPLLEIRAEALIETRQFADAEAAVEQLRKLNAPSAALDYLRGRLLLEKGDAARAARLLAGAQEALAGSPTAARKVDLVLAAAYERMGNVEQQVAACRRAADREPDWAPGRLALASALLKAGKVDEAASHCRAVLERADAPAEATALLIRTLLIQNLRLPKDQRRWVEVERRLGAAGKPASAPAEASLLRAELLAAQDRFGEAEELLLKARGEHPREPGVWAALAELAEQQGDTAKADTLFREALEKLGDRAELWLARIGLWARRGGGGLRERLTFVEGGAEKLPEDDRDRVLSAVADAYRRSGDATSATRIWRTLTGRRPEDVRPLLHLFEEARRAGDDAEMVRWAEGLRKAEGEDGVYWRAAEAGRLVAAARKGDRGGLARARELHGEAARRWPEWGPLLLLRGQLDELEGKPREALDAYLGAVRKGDERPEILGVAARLLHREQRYVEADELLRKLERPRLLAGGLGRVAAEVSLALRDRERALDFARRAVDPESRDPLDHLWLGQILWVSGRPEEAEAAFRKATTLAPDSPPAQVALIRFLSSTGKGADAEGALKEARSRLTEDSAALALARCHEIAGQTEAASRLFKEAVARKPGDPATLRAAAEYHLRQRDGRSAEGLLRKLIDPSVGAGKEDVGRARRALAVELSGRGRFGLYREALALLERDRQEGGETDDNARALAVVQATRPGRRREAIGLLERPSLSGALGLDEKLLLARLYDAGREWDSVRRLLSTLPDPEGDDPRALFALARALLGLGEVQEAGRVVARLEKREPGGLRLAEVKARLLKESGKAAEARALLLDFAKSADAALPVVAALLEDMGEADAAEPLYRRFAERPGRPDAVFALAGHLARRGRLGEALDALEPGWKMGPPEVVAAAAVGLLDAAPQPDGKAVERVEAAILTAAGRSPKPAALNVALAALYTLDGRLAEAEKLYREVLRGDEKNVVALNNLAWVLARQDERGEEALGLARRAVEFGGPAPELLDTRAVAAFALGQNTAALDDLRRSLADTPTASAYFHLARVHEQLGAVRSAREALENGRALGLGRIAPHPLERGEFEQLARRLDPQGAGKLP